MKRLVTTLALAALVAPSGGRADCVPVAPSDEIARSDLIFVGTVTSVQDRQITFRVEQVWKGAIGPTVGTTMDPMRFYVDGSAVGQRFVIFMRRLAPDRYAVNDCGNSQTGPEMPRLIGDLRAAGLRPQRPLRPAPHE